MGKQNQSGLIRSSGQANFIAVVALLVFAAFHPLMGFEIHFAWSALMMLAAALLTYASVTVIVASRDLDRYGSLLIYDAFLRFAAAGILMVTSYFVGLYGVPLLIAGLSDLLWGLAYCVIVPQATGRSVRQLLAARETPSTRGAPVTDVDLAYRI